MQNPKIGKYTRQGTEYPTETLSGKPYSRAETDPPPAIVHHLTDSAFAVGDVFAAPGFDVDAALAKLRAELAAAERVQRKPVEKSE